MQLPVEMARLFTEEKIDFVKRSGLKAEVLEPGRVCLRMPLQGNQNHIGSMYAGALFTLAEIPGGAHDRAHRLDRVLTGNKILGLELVTV